ncbi:MAG: aldehyde dehydrogenase family protein [Oligoflexia bacterium]|nr:aldehyde dehydrogenase family protein [Oligoflexia bacterium]
MAKPRFSFPVRGNLIDNRFLKPADMQGGASGEWISRCPGDFADEVGKFQYSYAAIDLAVGSARKAFPSWRKLAFAARAEAVRRFQSVLHRREEELAEVVAREIGRPLWDAATEVAGAASLLEVSLAEGLAAVADYEIPGISEGTLGACHYRPHGVMVVLGTYSHPLQAPIGHLIPALLAGNTVVLKPSEKAPMVGQLLAELAQEAALPPGVFNVLQGEKEVGRRLCVHEGVDGILFTGSYEVGARIKQDTLQQHWKLLVLEMGGKNSTIIWEDAELEHALRETLLATFISAGQRCNSTSRILVHEALLERFVERFHARSKAFSIGHPLDNPFMGPMIEQGAVDRYMKFVGIANREGCDIVMRGKSLELPVLGNYVTPSICVVRSPSVEASRKSVFQQTEFLGPSAVILPVKTLEEAVAQANVTQFGLTTSVFTRSRTVFDRARDELQAGIVNWNRSTIEASPRLPFGGLKKSGNHFPSGIVASRYCTYPVASLERPEPKNESGECPGLNWEAGS